MIKSPLRYPGGKSRAVRFLAQFIPDFLEFREIFFGGGSLSIYLTQLLPHKKYYANDINYDLFCFWQELKGNSEVLIQELYKIKAEYINGRELFKTIISRRNNQLSNLQRALDFFVLNRITFSGIVDSGGYSEAAFLGRFTISAINRLKETVRIIQYFDFTGADYTNLLHKPGKEIFIFLDPPYHNNKPSKLYGKKGELHTTFNHELLLENVKKYPHKLLITYNNSPYIKELYKDYYIYEWNLQYGMNNYKQKQANIGREVIITNYLHDSSLIQPNFQIFPTLITSVR